MIGIFVRRTSWHG